MWLGMSVEDRLDVIAYELRRSNGILTAIYTIMLQDSLDSAEANKIMKEVKEGKQKLHSEKELKKLLKKR